MQSSKKFKVILLLLLIPFAAIVVFLLQTPVKNAIREKRTRALVDYIKRSECWGSSSECYYYEIDWLIDNGADVEAKMPPNGENLMYWCAKRMAGRDYDIILRLQRAGAKTDKPTQRLLTSYRQKLIAENSDGLTPLGRAIDNDDVPTLKLLLSKGANVREKCSDEPLLSFALRHNANPEVIAVLKAAKAPTNPTIELTIAVVQNRPADVRKLIRSGVDINTTDKEADDHWTPLMWAADAHNTEMVRLLLKLGANPNLKGNNYWGDVKRWTALRVSEQSMGDWNERKKTIALLKTVTRVTPPKKQ